MESLFSSYPSEISIENYTTLAVLMIMSYCNTVPALIPAVVVSDQRPPSGGRTFRIRGVPNDWDKDRLESFLAEKDGSAGLAVQSLANEIHGRSQTATVSSQSTSYLPQRIPLPLFSDQLRKSRSLTLDLDFLGITALFAPPQQDHKVDIIAISGLGGHAFGSFKERQGEHMWLRDSLPYDITGESSKRIKRVMVYGYESRLPNSASFQNIEDLGTSLHSSLLTLATDNAFKPIVFIAHSLGGLVVKQLLISLSNSNDELNKKLRRAVYGIAFFGVPHDGMDIRSLIPMAGDGPNRFLLESIGSNSSQILSIQQREFSQALGGQGESEIVSFYETRLSPTASKDKEGRWSMTGKPAVLVSKSSATHCRPWEVGPEHICAINRTHSDMVKFAEEDDEYDKVVGHIRTLVQRALTARRSPLLPNLSQQEQNCLQSLAFKQMLNRGNDIERAIQGTCAWLLQHETYINWTASHRGLLWIKGKPGAGKSTLLKYALSKQRELPSARDSDLVLSFFFHGRGDTLQKTPLGFFRSLLHQVLTQAPEALSDLVDVYQERCNGIGNPPEKWQWHPEELWRFFESSLPRILTVRPVWLFVDALDECGEMDALDLAMKFQSLLQSSSVSAVNGFHICFSCRHYPIPPDLEGVLEICLEDENGEDVSTYVRQKLSECPVRKASSIANLITARASGIFMWARLVMERVLSLERKRESWKKIEEEIHSIPLGMDNLYQDHIQRMVDKTTSLRLIQWICFATRPLSLIELYWALAVDADCSYKSLEQCGSTEDYGNDNDMEKRVIALSCGLAESVTSSTTRTVQFIHQSVKDFFIDKGLVALNSSSTSTNTAIGMAHFQLSRTCIRYFAMEEISQSTRYNRDEMKADFPFLPYATNSWVTHTQQSDALGIPQEDLLELFAWPSNVLIHLWTRVLMKMGAVRYLRQYDLRGASLLHIAARHQFLGAMNAILRTTSQTAISVDPMNESGRTPLSLVAENGHEVMVKLLLSTGQVDVNSKDGNSKTPLSWAAKNGHEAIVKLLLSTGQVDVNLKDGNSQTPLSWAAENGHEAVVRLLLSTGQVDVDSKDEYSRTPLSWAVINGHEAVVRLLLDTGKIDVDLKDKDSRTPLSWAAMKGYEAVVRLLLDTGQVNVDLKDENSQTPLSLAEENGHEAIVKLLKLYTPSHA